MESRTSSPRISDSLNHTESKVRRRTLFDLLNEVTVKVASNRRLYMNQGIPDLAGPFLEPCGEKGIGVKVVELDLKPILIEGGLHLRFVSYFV